MARNVDGSKLVEIIDPPSTGTVLLMVGNGEQFAAQVVDRSAIEGDSTLISEILRHLDQALVVELELQSRLKNE